MTASKAALGAYLRARRDALLPHEAGLSMEPNRRVRGLRRQEVASIAGISSDYYLRLEQGRDHQPSPQVLLALGRALQLDADALVYLFRLAGQTLPSTVGDRLRPQTPQPPDELIERLTTMLTQGTSAPAYVVDRNQDVLAVNELGRSVIPFRLGAGANMVEAIVDGALQTADDRREYWDQAVREATAALRYHGDPQDPRLELLAASLSSRSPVFRDVWESHEAHPQRRGVALVQIEPFGYIPFRCQTLEVPGGGQYLTTFFGDPGSPAAAAVEYLRAKLRVEEALREAGPGVPAPQQLNDPGFLADPDTDPDRATTRSPSTF